MTKADLVNAHNEGYNRGYAKAKKENQQAIEKAEEKKKVASALAYQRTVGVDNRIAELENKIADIKANCDLAIEGRDVKIMELEQQIEQAKEDVVENESDCANCGLRQENAELKEELAKWKDEWQEQVQKAIDEGYARTQQTIQLTKANSLLADVYKIAMSDWNDPKWHDQVLRNAREYLKEIEK